MLRRPMRVLTPCPARAGRPRKLPVEKEIFVGPNAEAANALLKRPYREPYVVPEISA